MMKKLLLGGIALSSLLVAVSANAADLPPPQGYKAQVAVPPVYSWTGCYIGGNGGFGWNTGRSGYNDVNALGDPINGNTNQGTSAFVPIPSNTDGSGGLGGVGAGCNWQSQRFVYGIEGDFDWTHFSGGQNTTVSTGPAADINLGPGFFTGVNTMAAASEQVSLRWLSTIRGRVGFAAQDHLLLFVTGGLAVGEVNSQGSVRAFDTPTFLITAWGGSASTTRTGLVVGAGGEWAFADHWTAKAEYLWYDLGNASHPLNCTFAASTCAILVFPTLGSTSAAVHGSIVRAGINFKFN